MNVLRSISRFLLVIVLVLGVSCTPGKRITKANVEEVEEGMSKKQVESILGHPTSVTNEDPVIMHILQMEELPPVHPSDEEKIAQAVAMQARRRAVGRQVDEVRKAASAGTH